MYAARTRRWGCSEGALAEFCCAFTACATQVANCGRFLWQEADEWGDTAEGGAGAEDSGVIGGSGGDAGSLIDGADPDDGLEYLELEGEREMWAPLTTRRQRRMRSLVGLGALAVQFFKS